MKKYYCKDCKKELKNRYALRCKSCASKGENNPNHKHGKYSKLFKNYCIDCGKRIDRRAKRCCSCSNRLNRLNKKHNKKTKLLIGLKSKEKFTESYIEKIYRSKCRGNKKRDINGYILIKNYTHPNRNSHNDILEHIFIISNFLNRPLKRGEIVHHINFIRNDNRLKNLYLFKNNSEHLKSSKSLFKLVAELLKRKIIKFNNGAYKLINKRG